MIVDLQGISRIPRHFDLQLQPGWWRGSGGDEQIQGLEGPLRTKISVFREDKKFVAEGHLSGNLRVVCDRCLEIYTLPVIRNYRLFFSPPAFSEPVKNETELSKKDLAVGFIAAEKIDLDDIIREQIYLSLPMKLLCRKDCAGLCSQCGVNLNMETCKCPEKNGHPAFLKLKALKIRERSS